MDIDTLKETLRDVYGLDDASLSEGVSLTSMINQAVKKISTYYPEIELTSTSSVANQTRYTVSHSNLITLKEVYYSDGGGGTTDVFGSSIKVTAESYSDSTFTNSRKLTSDMERANLRKFYPYGADIVSYNKFDLIPTPTSVSTIYYEYSRYRTIEEIPDLFEEDIIELVYFYLEEQEFKNNRLTSSGNVFQFDRRGNSTTSSASELEMKSRTRNDKLKSIENSIKMKVMKLG